MSTEPSSPGEPLSIVPQSMESALTPAMGPEVQATLSGEVDPELAIESLLQDPDLVQLVTRHTVAGTDQMIVHQQVDFAPRQETAVLQVPIVPAMAVSPSIEIDIPTERIRARVTDCQGFGIRVELVRMPPCHQAESIRLGLSLAATSCRPTDA